MWHDVGAGGAAVGLRTGAHVVAEDSWHALAAVLALEPSVQAVQGSFAATARVAGWAVALVAALGAGLVGARAAHAGALHSARVMQLAVFA